MKVKRHFSIIVFSFTLLCAGLAYFSCSNISSSSQEDVPDGKVRLCGTLNLPETDGAVPGEILALINSAGNDVNAMGEDFSGARAASFTEPILSDTSTYEYYVIADNGTNTVENATWADDGSFSMQLAYGSWDVEAGVRFKGTNKSIFSSTEHIDLPEGGPKTYSKSFVAKPNQSDDKKGKINLEMTTGSNSDISIAEINFLSGNDIKWNALFSGTNRIKQVSNNKVTIGGPGVELASGTYTVQINFYDYDFSSYSVSDASTAITDGTAVLLYSTVQTINIYDNLETNRWFSTESSNSNNPIDNSTGKFTLSDTILGNFVLTSICVSANGSDTNMGTVYNPYKTIKKAVSYIENISPIQQGKDYTIYISGEVTVDSANDYISGAPAYVKSITIKGKSGNNANDILKGSGNGCTLSIETNVPVTIENLTITGGNNTSGQGKGGGIDLFSANAKVILGNGAKVTGNKAKYGGGVYVRDTTTLLITGTALIGDSTNSKATSDSDCSNYSTSSGGGIYNEGSVYLGYTLNSSNTPTTSSLSGGVKRNFSEAGGAGIHNAEGSQLYINSGYVSYNVTKQITNVGNPGGGIRVHESKLELSGGEISYNEADAGGGIEAASKADITISGGKIAENTSRTGFGGAIDVYEDSTESNSAKVYLKGSFSIPYGVNGTKDIGKNDIYLCKINSNYAKLYVTGSITPPSGVSTVATIRMPEWKRGLKFLQKSGSDITALTDTIISKFSFTDDDWEKKLTTISSTNDAAKIDSPVYVAGTNVTGTVLPTGFGYGKTAANGALGTKSKPFSTINDALGIFDSTSEAEIKIAGTVIGQQVIGGTGVTFSPTKIKLTGYSSGTIKRYNSKPTNAASDGTALKIDTTVPVTINGVTISNGKSSTKGGGIYLAKSGAKVILGDNTIITNNEAASGGGVYVLSGTSLEISGSAQLTGNIATNGGAVYNEGTFTMTAGTIGGSSTSQNSVTGTGATGGAVYQGGTFYISGTAYVYPGSEGTNDVYLNSSSKYITVKDTWSGSQANNKMAITPYSWTRGTQVIDGSKAATYYSYFKTSDSEWSLGYTSGSTWTLSDDLKTRIGADIWVAGTSNTANGVGTPNNSNRGTKSKPYATIEKAVNQCWSTSLDFKINVSGNLTAAQIIPAANSTNKTALAKSILIKGATANTKDLIKPTSGRGLTISNTASISIQDIQITGGNATGGNGGGIYMGVAKARLTLKTGALITGNSTSYSGGGVYFAGTKTGDNYMGIMIMESGSQISNNTASSFGGGVCLSYAHLCMAGTAIIGSTSTVIAESGNNKHSNKAGQGGGVYCSNSSTLWLGYSEPADNKTSALNDGRGVVYNYSDYSSYSYKGGGVFVCEGSTLKMNSGDISYNLATYASSQGGGIYSEGTTIISGGRILGNGASNGGGIYANKGTLWLKGGTIGTAGAVNETSSSPEGIYMSSSSVFKVSGAPSVYSGNKVKSYTPIQVAGSLDGTEFVFSFTPSSYSIGTTVVELAEGVSNPALENVAGRFALDYADGIAISASGTIISTEKSFSTSTFKDYYQSLPKNTPETPIKLTLKDITSFQNFSQFLSDNNLYDRYIDLSFENATFTLYKEVGSSCYHFTKITLPASCTQIDLSDWSGTSLKEIHVASGNTAFKDIDGVLYSKDGKTLVWYPGKREATSYTVVSGTETIEENAFNNNSVLTSLTICSGVKKMKKRCLEGCSAITSLSLPDTLTEIGDFAIWCSKLKTLTIPAGVNKIGINVFYGASSLESMTVSSSNTSFMIKDGMLYSKDGKTIVACPAKLNKTSYVIPSSVTKICSRTFSETSFKANVTFNSNCLTGWKKYSEYDEYLRDIDATQSALNAAVCESTGYLVRQ